MVMSTGTFTDQIVLITGAAQGQGAAEAHAFAEQGAFVVLCDVLDDEGRKVAAAIGDRSRYHHLDVRDYEQWSTVVAAVEADLGRISILINNAGIMRAGDLLELTERNLRDVLDINLLGTIFGMQVVGRSIRDNGGGAIVNVSSTSGLRAGPRQSVYAASKWGVRGVSKAAAIDLAKHGIRVNSVHPGAIETPMTANAGLRSEHMVERHGERILIPRMGTAQEVADLVLYLCSPDAAYITGGEFVIDGGLTVG
jgi:3alpha(or 20beta)-hydroxysteroid dehydrogenase